ncbi:MAG: 2Fe-2S iron-sulfur cluster-binding protein [Myxococcales bacterium]|nr:2Fe-2S iron-sulfur cluster-binding protein [Myxococcota bacterium]MDW8281135.1 2Fe-2S iron-sulfur cluster-binding protein [Myxococcales bacterium]
MADDPKKTKQPATDLPARGSSAPPPGVASSTHIATRRSGSGLPLVPPRPATGEGIKPSIADALRETADAVQEAVRELTGKTQLAVPVAVVQPTPAQIRAADALSRTLLSPRPPSGPQGSRGPSPPAPAPAPGEPAAGETKPVDMVTLKVDGREVSVPRGTNVLEACLKAGVEVSYFCYHPGLSSPAVCRQCLVEVVGQPKLVPSCYTPVADQMEVLASSPRALLARQQMLEFTLVNHPVDCPICDKAGECLLQKHYMDWDGKDSRTDFDKVHKPKVVDLGPYIVLDAERCILCTRCIRVCDEVAGQHQLEMAWRGDRQELVVAPGQRLDNPYSLNTVDVCPVGALTSKDFRFRMRVWELYTVDSICPGCATGCNIEVHHHQGEVWRLVPRENREVNGYWMCDEGRFTYKELRRARVAGARIGMGKGMPGQVASIDKAVSYAAERLGRICDDKGTVGLVFGAQAQNEALYALYKVAELLAEQGVPVRRYVLGRAPRPERQDNILRSADVNPNTAGAQLLAGPGAGGLAELRADLGAGVLKALWMVGEDVPIGAEELPALLPLLDRLQLLIVQAVHDTEIVRRAQVILPAAAWAEVDGTFTNAKGMVQRIRRAVDPPGTARPHLELVGLMSQKLGLARGQGWQGSPRQAFLHMTGAITATLPPPDMSGPIPAPLRGFARAEWGRDMPPVQLRFANARG